MKKVFSALLIAVIIMTAMLLTACPTPEPAPDPDHTHTFVDEVVDPTCISGGYTIHTCSGCGYVMKDTFTGVDTKNHDYVVKESVDATCDEDAYTVDTCTLCGDSKVTVKKNTAGHVWGEWVTVNEHTCTDWGYKKRECENCGEVDGNSIKPSHSYESTTVEPTCTEPGQITYTCTECGDTYTTQGQKALGHDPGEWTVVREHTCTDHGEKVRECERDGCEYTETTVESTELHYYEFVETIEPTETSHGYDIWKCTECDKMVIKNITHNFTAWEPCTDDPSKEHCECTACGHEEHRTKS